VSEASADETRYLGVDLAWSGTALSGVSATDARGRVLADGVLSSDDLLRWIAEHRGTRSVLAIDAPLLFRATTPALRPAERALHRQFGRYHAGPFPGGPGSTAMAGRTASPALEIVRLAGGYSTDPFARAALHRAIEVFPAPAWITLGGRTSRIRYKRGRLQERVSGLSEARHVLRSVIGPDATLGPSLEAAWAAARTAREWKSVEDMVDARLCAHVALLWDTVGTDEWVVTGDGTIEDGYIIVPDLPVDPHRARAAPDRPDCSEGPDAPLPPEPVDGGDATGGDGPEPLPAEGENPASHEESSRP
jgi:predicted RNase H-like nuclease